MAKKAMKATDEENIGEAMQMVKGSGINYIFGGAFLKNLLQLECVVIE